MSELSDIRESTGELQSSLTHRETEVLALSSQGLTNMEIAAQLAVTIHAVKFHLAAIYRKLGVENRTKAAAIYFRSQPDRDIRL